MNDRWFYYKDGVRLGPITFDALKALVESKAVGPLDLVWCSDFGKEWLNVAQVEALKVKRFTAPSSHLQTKKTASDFDPTLSSGSYCPSVAEAVEISWKWMKTVLFNPFSATRWFGIGFCAWLASFGSGSGGNFQQRGASSEDFKLEFDHLATKVVDFLSDPLKLSGVTLFILFIGLLYVIILKLKSRGDFMFVRRWYSPDDTITECWHATLENANKFFAWRIRFYGVLLLISLINAGTLYINFLVPYVASEYLWDIMYVRSLVVSAVIAVISWFVLIAGESFGVGFVVPVLHWHNVSVARAWGKVFALCNQFPGAVMLYVLSLIGMWIGFVVIMIVVIILTCCIAVFPLMIPYLGAVCLLPALFFFRGYSICFLAQWRDDFIPGVDVDKQGAL